VPIGTPDTDAHPVAQADWLELHALSSRYGNYTVEELIGARELNRDEEAEDIADDDAAAEDLLLRTCDEILRRQAMLGEDYPFSLSDDGGRIECGQRTGGGDAYVFCLWLSQAAPHGMLPGRINPITPRDRDLFQVCATLAAAGFIQGHALSFGWPRPDSTTFLDALKIAYKQVGEGKPKERIPPGVSAAVKDAGVDVIAWREVPDNICGRLYMLGQAASGRDWRGKSLKPIIPSFHQDFFVEPPSSPTVPAIFIPFCPQESPPPSAGYDVDVHVDADLCRLTREFGILFYRYRLVYYAAEGLRLATQGTARIERAEEFTHISERINGLIEGLRAMEAT
jgi:hypothetical protein